MTEINKDTIEYLSKLSQIESSENEVESLIKDLKKILPYAETLNDVDTTYTEPCDHVLNLTNVSREDKIGSTTQTETFIKNAPSSIGTMIRVPPVKK